MPPQPSSSSSPTPSLNPSVVLHPDDANSKVFQAIARAFLAVDNRALTVKDLAESALEKGLAAQSVSAASQAITTYIRMHLQRCEEQNDIPLLCQHKLSGTAVDDDLLPALHSTTGGAQPPSAEATRSTNFRKGTSIWYLSRAAGAPCPFTRAGLRLHDYPPPKEKKPPVRDLTTLKRKRVPRGSSANDSPSETERPPPKVKFTLRLKPIPSLPASHTGPVPKTISSRIINIPDSEDDSDASMSSDFPHEPSVIPSQAGEAECLPPYPRRSISIPLYTPSVERPYLFFPPAPPQPVLLSNRRSPSLPLSVASPPPDSDDDMDIDSATGGLHNSSFFQPSLLDDDSDCDADSEGDGETSWDDINVLRSPSTSSVLPLVRVKRESDAHLPSESWESGDPFGVPNYDAAKIKTEAMDSWAWERGYQDYFADDEGAFPVKKEEPSLVISPLDPPYDPASSPSTASSSSESLENTSTTSQPPARSRIFTNSSLIRPGDDSEDFIEPLPRSLVSLIHSMTVKDAALEHCVSPQECVTANSVITSSGLPADSAVSATQLEGIPVYQMPAGSHTLLRRVDTDFVNLNTIAAHAGTPLPVWSTIPNATTVTAGSSWVLGTWVSLPAAQVYVHDHCPSGTSLDVFLSDRLHEHFPSLLQAHRQTTLPHPHALHFGAPFGLALHSHLQSDVASILPSPSVPSSCDGSFDFVPEVNVSSGSRSVEDFPLSPSEQEMFHALCWEEDSLPHLTSPQGASSRSSSPSPPKSAREERQGLRRSKRVADAIAYQPPQSSRVRSRRKGSGSRNSDS